MKKLELFFRLSKRKPKRYKQPREQLDLSEIRRIKRKIATGDFDINKPADYIAFKKGVRRGLIDKEDVYGRDSNS